MRYLRLLAIQFRMSVAIGAQYRWDFLVSGVLAVVWTLLGLVPLWVAFHARPSVEGWTFGGVLVVVGWFTLLKSVLEGAVNPSLVQVVDQIRQGTLDFVLIKPADAQFLVSSARFEPWRVVDSAGGFAILAWGLAIEGRVPSGASVGTAVVLFAAATAVLYSLWILVIAAAFYVVRLDNLAYLFNAIFDFARWPVSIFKGVYRIVFTFVIPLAVMTTFPAEALLGTLAPRTAIASLAGSLAFAVGARWVWTRAIAHYTSASS
jgi:ABC-2 type transport system permease protein